MNLITALAASLAVSAGPLIGYWAFADFDVDADGYVSMTELRHSELFTVWDGDEDDGLLPGQLGDRELFLRWDEDGNLRLSAEEFYTGFFETYDRDGDGLLTEENWESIELFE